MRRKPENRAIDTRILNAIARYRGLTRRTLAIMFPDVENQKVYARCKYLVNKKILNEVIYNKYREDGVSAWHYKLAVFYYFTPDGLIKAKDDLAGNIEPSKLNIPPTHGELNYLYLVSKLILKIPYETEDGRRFRHENKIPDNVKIDLICNNWLIIYERNPSVAVRHKLPKQCSQLLAVENVKGIILLCKTKPQKETMERFWRWHCGPKSTYFFTQNEYLAITSVLND